eukprot:m51a1_g10772 putative general transcription factor iih (340) ;mRNA; r:44101-45251
MKRERGAEGEGAEGPEGAAGAAAAAASLLVVVVDAAWPWPAQAALWAALRACCALGRAFLLGAGRAPRRLCLCAALPGPSSAWLLPAPGASQPRQLSPRSLCRALARCLASSASASASASPAAAGAALAGALGRALCRARSAVLASALDGRAEQGQAPAQGQGQGQGQCCARVLVVSPAPDAPAKYFSVVNAAWAARGCGVVVDACVVGGATSGLLQQAASLTGGVYAEHGEAGTLAHVLLSAYGVEQQARRCLSLPAPAALDDRAGCCCHEGRPTSHGLVCSVCLSLFCDAGESAACATCGARFWVPPGTVMLERRHAALAEPMQGDDAVALPSVFDT